MKHFKKAVLITGTPGVGKTTVANKLARLLKAECIGVTELVKTENLVTEVDDDRQTLVADTEKVLKRIEQILDETQGLVIVEGHYVVDVVPVKEVEIVFVLRRDPRELEKVLQERGYKKNKVNENLSAEILDSCLWDAVSAVGSDLVCEVNVNNRTVDDVVDEILLVLNDELPRVVGMIDWLATLESEGQIEDFLKKIDLSKES
ncbi:MAG: adenylate kinase family protein [Candidatus Bathyarchaeota archaeon]|nr:adenylate kinase family protein [Candidatus Bathyarchaeota archaeon]